MQDYCDNCGDEESGLAECWGSDGSMVLCGSCRENYHKCTDCGNWVHDSMLTDGLCVVCDANSD